MIQRNIIEHYNYNVMKQENDNLIKIGTLETKKALRSVKQRKAELEKAKLDVNSIVISNGISYKKYEISEEDFIKNATEIVE